jgi:hypothetical protein
MWLVALLLLVCLVLWNRTKEPFDLRRTTDFFELADPYMADMTRLYLELKRA